MPETNGKLSAAELQRAVDWLNKQGIHGNCPRCSKAAMNIADLVVTLPAYTPSLLKKGPEMPCVAVVCSHCGYVELHNAIMAGVVPPDEKTDTVQRLPPSPQGGTNER